MHAGKNAREPVEERGDEIPHAPGAVHLPHRDSEGEEECGVSRRKRRLKCALRDERLKPKLFEWPGPVVKEPDGLYDDAARDKRDDGRLREHEYPASRAAHVHEEQEKSNDQKVRRIARREHDKIIRKDALPRESMDEPEKLLIERYHSDEDLESRSS